MANATADRATIKGADVSYQPQNKLNIPAATKVYQGTMQIADANGRCANPVTVAARVVGVAKDHYDNSLGANDAMMAEFQTGYHEFAKAGVNTPTLANLFLLVYAEDNQTIGNLSTAGSKAGILVAVMTNSVGVLVGPQFAQA